MNVEDASSADTPDREQTGPEDYQGHRITFRIRHRSDAGTGSAAEPNGRIDATGGTRTPRSGGRTPRTPGGLGRGTTCGGTTGGRPACLGGSPSSRRGTARSRRRAGRLAAVPEDGEVTGAPVDVPAFAGGGAAVAITPQVGVVWPAWTSVGVGLRRNRPAVPPPSERPPRGHSSGRR